MRILPTLFCASLSVMGLSSMAFGAYEFESKCYQFQDDVVVQADVCTVTSLPQGDHHFATLDFNGEEFFLADEFTYTDELRLEGDYTYLVNHEVADLYFRDEQTLKVITESQYSESENTLLCYKSQTVDVCY